MMAGRHCALLVGALIAMRAVMAALLPLSADEAYYWLWSRHLAAGYFDHPPAIAFLIRAGTLVFGDTAFGVRAAGIVLSLAATGFVWGAGRRLGLGGPRAMLGALLFNLTLMISVEMLAATPDMPSVATSAAFFYALTRVDQDRRWWLAAGAAAGLGLLSKYSALFLGAGTLVWLLLSPRHRRQLATVWPWAGAGAALLLFAPNLIWQAGHHWMTFAFQFARVEGGHFTLRFLGEFLAAQLGLATPLIFALMLSGLWRARRREQPLFLPAMLVAVGAVYFLIHALHDRVQGNWPCFLYPMLAVLAASAFVEKGWRGWGWVSRLAAPLAGLLLAFVYLQAAFQPLPRRGDPLARMLGRDFRPAGAAAAASGGAILTTDYETTAWLRFYAPDVTVIQVNEPWRYPAAPQPGAALLRGRLFYLVTAKRDRHKLIANDFAEIGPPLSLGTYRLYPVGKPKGGGFGKMP
jgi:4-amino-4-deoxy-L-arabinose transferase-like glycosyltransferase